MTDTPNPIVWDAEAHAWRYDLGERPDGIPLMGLTVCCKRYVYAPEGPLRPVLPLILGCCDTPGVPEPVELPPYSGEHAVCRKCGSKAVETEHRVSDDSHMLMIPPGYPPEWLRRSCAVCRARWDEACVTEGDAPECDPLELVDLARVTVKPGDKLLIRPRPEFWPLGDDFIERLIADLERLFPGVQVIILPAPVDVAVIEGDGAAPPEKPDPSPLNAQPWSVWSAGSVWWMFHAPSGQFLPVVRDALEGIGPERLAELGGRPLSDGGGDD